jgi:hypothetical protein
VGYSQILDVLMNEVINISTEEHSQELDKMVQVNKDVSIVQYFNMID